MRSWMPRSRRRPVVRHRPVVFLHIGTMKTGTSFLQKLLSVNKANLADGGYLFPGTWKEQGKATRDVLEMVGRKDAYYPQVAGTWDRLATEMVNHRGKASIFSHEFLSFTNANGAKKAVKSLTSRGAEVHVILVVRDAIRVLPSQWQTHCRSGGVVSWPEFAVSARSLGELGPGEPAPPEPGRSGARVFQRAQGVPRMLRAWGSALPPGCLHVVTVPLSGSDPMLLWERFAEVIGVDPALCREPVHTANLSIGQASAELMRRINIDLGPTYMTDNRQTVKSQLASRVLAERSKLEGHARLDVETLQFAANWNRRVRAAVEASGADVVGDLKELPVEVPQHLVDGAAPTLDDPTDDEILAAAVTAWDGTHRLVDRRVKALGKVPGAGIGLDSAATTSWQLATVDRWRTAPHPVAAAVAEIAVLVRVADDVQRRLDASGTTVR